MALLLVFLLLVIPLALLIGFLAFLGKAIPALRKTWASRDTWRR